MKQTKTYYYIIEIWTQTLISELDLRRMCQKFWDFDEEKVEKNWIFFFKLTIFIWLKQCKR